MTPFPESAFEVIRHRHGAVWLDAGRGARGWSILAWSPVEVVTAGADWVQSGRRLSRQGSAQTADCGRVPFAGGCLGYLGYGAGHRVESIPAEAPTPEPEVWLGQYEGALCFRHDTGRWLATGSPSFRAEAHRVLDRAAPITAPPPPPTSSARTVPREQFEQDVRAIQALIGAGDCYQVNLTRPVYVSDPGDPWDAYRRLRAISPADHGAYLRLADELAVLSNSPELFLSIRGRRATSRPIKGTRPRHADPHTDRALADELAASEKERAELAMIVDLVRNDLGRVAVPGTVRADQRAITHHANVHHASVDVTAELEEGRDAWDALAATFPPGSVTGAPKIRACQRIAELETAPRGVYCGAIGYVSTTGDAAWSVAIRTAVFCGDAARYHVGGGIVADSLPHAEWLETEHKGRALAWALSGGPSDMASCDTGVATSAESSAA